MIRKHNRRSTFLSIIAVLLSLLLCGKAMAVLNPDVEEDYELKLLGKYVFFDKISEPERMACVTCHAPNTGGTFSISGVNLHQVVVTGANPHTAGNVKTPTNTYASLLAPFHECDHGGLGAPPFVIQDYCGGNFWNGRAEGRGPENAVFFGDNYIPPTDKISPVGATPHLGLEVFQGGAATKQASYMEYLGPTADQALNPMLNVVEQNKKDHRDVCLQVKAAKYAPLYFDAWGVEINCSLDPAEESAKDVPEGETEADISFKRIILAVCAWQDSKDLNSFSSKRDIAIANEVDKHGVATFPLDDFTCKENYGHDLFYGQRGAAPVKVDRNYDCVQDVDKDNVPIVTQGAGCAFCHSNAGPAPNTGTDMDELYTAQDYHSIGTPFNPEIPVLYPQNALGLILQPLPDEGIKSHLLDPLVPDYPYPPGFWKTPTVRNVDKRPGKGFIKAYMHNGYFKSLERVVHFYNTAAVDLATAESFNIIRCPLVKDPTYHPSYNFAYDDYNIGTDGHRPMTDKEAEANNCWPEPEFDIAGAIPFLVGNLGLKLEDEAAIVAYLKALTDLETPVAPRPWPYQQVSKKK